LRFALVSPLIYGFAAAEEASAGSGANGWFQPRHFRGGIANL